MGEILLFGVKIFSKVLRLFVVEEQRSFYREEFTSEFDRNYNVSNGKVRLVIASCESDSQKKFCRMLEGYKVIKLFYRKSIQ